MAYRKPETALTPDMLLYAYSVGIFPMADSLTGEVHWYQPKLRAIIPIDTFKPPRSLRQIIKKGIFEVRINTAFEQVMRHCATERGDGLGTWISEEMIEAYTRLHHLGYAHSVETFLNGELVGGLYGVAIGAAFFGESMFYRVSNASKVAFVALIERLRTRGFELLDSQYINDNVRRFGAIEIPHQDYIARLQVALRKPVSFV